MAEGDNFHPIDLPESLQQEILHLAGMLPISYRLRHKIPPKRLTSLPTIDVCTAQLAIIHEWTSLFEPGPNRSVFLRARRFASHNNIDYSHTSDKTGHTSFALKAANSALEV